jgi:hypothetical protein
MNSAIGERFRRQHGSISRADALALGLTHRQIALRVRSGEWIAAKPGVYRNAATPVTPEMLIVEAILSAGPAACASHGSAAYLWSMLTWSEAGERATVTVPAPRNPRRYGFDVHRTTDLQWERVRCWKGIDCTDPLRTLSDLGVVVSPVLLDRAVDRALSSGLVTVRGLEDEINRRSVRGRSGLGILRERLRARGLTGAPRSTVLEMRGVQFLKRYGLPVLAREVVAGSGGEYRIDFVLAPRLGWELDGYVWHFSPEHKSRDERRRNRLRAEGWELYISDWRSLSREPLLIAQTLRLAIARSERSA